MGEEKVFRRTYEGRKIGIILIGRRKNNRKILQDFKDKIVNSKEI
jgi:hypothetical protein